MGILDSFGRKSGSNATKKAQQRKEESQSLLRSLNIPYIEHLPLLEEEAETKIRRPDEIAERILVLTYLNYVAEVPEAKEDVIAFLKNYSLWGKVSMDEQDLFQKDELSEREMIDISWRTEAIWLLLWTICRVDKLELPVKQVAIQDILSKLPAFMGDPSDFISTAVIKPVSEILDAADLIYRLHWAARDADLKGEPPPAELSLSIVTERHYAMNWVTYYEEDWDEITTDT